MIFSIVVSSVFAQAAEEKIVTIIQDANLAEAEWYKQMNADFEAETGIKVDAQFAASRCITFSCSYHRSVCIHSEILCCRNHIIWNQGIN